MVIAVIMGHRCAREQIESTGGVSVHHLENQFMNEVKARGFTRDATIYDIEPTVIRGKSARVTCPRDGRRGAAYVDVVPRGDSAPATHMLSYCWGYQVGDIVDALVAHCKRQSLDLRRVFVWICCLCINQHRVQEAKSASVRFDEFRKTFESRVVSIGHVLALLTPWENPAYTHRVWCVFEMYVATELEDHCKVEVIMPPRETIEFEKALVYGGLDSVWKAMGTVHVEHAEASVPSDKQHIMELVDDGPGTVQLNAAVVSRLRDFFVMSSSAHVMAAISYENAGREFVHTCATVAELLEHVGRFQKALDLIQKTLELLERHDNLTTFESALLMRIEAVVRRRLVGEYTWRKQWQDREEMLEVAHVRCDFARNIHRTLKTLDKSEGASLLTIKGILHGLPEYDRGGNRKETPNGLYDQMSCFTSAYSIREKLGLLECLEGASLVRNIGVCFYYQKDYEIAERHFLDSKELFKVSDCMSSPECAALMQNLGDLRRDQGRFPEALDAYTEAKEISLRTGTTRTFPYKRLLRNARIMLEGLGWHEEAAKFEEKTKSPTSCCGART
eukprot:TRINITY_DN48430_c0_g1_i1.p1 TRINITY_DN48430_c0_g1~~TRINITY_DN48430_c0_g1_i1.p1  ORF type:complete len:561 (-),score=75.02 TRINITY_DN48430_c0_g1_i1:277-1959(-)